MTEYHFLVIDNHREPTVSFDHKDDAEEHANEMEGVHNWTVQRIPHEPSYL